MSFFVSDFNNGYGASNEHRIANLGYSNTIESGISFADRQERIKFLQAICELPEKRTPLLARVIDRIEELEHTTEKTLYESVPGYVVPALYHAPKHLKAPAPAVLIICGYHQTDKTKPEFQRTCHDLVRSGFIVLEIHSDGQDELNRYRNLAGMKRLEDRYLAYHFVCNTIRAVDYLISRPEVDTTRIGLASGDDNQTGLLMMCEPRLAAAVPFNLVSMMQTMLSTATETKN